MASPAAGQRLTKGHAFPALTFAVSKSDAMRYLDATGDDAQRRLGGDTVPPLALAAFGLRALLTELDLPGGSVHTGEELEFERAVRYEAPMRCETQVVQSSDRQGHRFATVEQRLLDQDGAVAMTARASIIVPLHADGGSS